jgi:hypothetical protein
LGALRFLRSETGRAPWLIQALVTAWRSDPSWEVRNKTMEALVQLGVPHPHVLMKVARLENASQQLYLDTLLAEEPPHQVLVEALRRAIEKDRTLRMRLFARELMERINRRPMSA